MQFSLHFFKCNIKKDTLSLFACFMRNINIADKMHFSGKCITYIVNTVVFKILQNSFFFLLLGNAVEYPISKEISQNIHPMTPRGVGGRKHILEITCSGL